MTCDRHAKVCECGCNAPLKDPTKRFIYHHNSKGQNHPQWNGGRTTSSDQCILIMKSNHPRANNHGYVREHILRYEEHYQCCLLSWAVICHKDGNKRNNAPSNLQPFTRSQFSRICVLKKPCLPPPKKGASNPHWNGGRIIHKGYVLIRMPTHPRANTNGYVREHIVVMERKLGRPLRPNEVVNHLNKIKSDNSEENLELLPSQSEHIKMYARNRSKSERIAYAIRMKEYGAKRSLRNSQICPRCGSNVVHKNGWQYGKQMYQCTLCYRNFQNKQSLVIGRT